ncbi:MAG: triose-phosphate isomerase [Clostridia bacterium]|jgi:triosephosphate isomerase (TIM)|nr:triose-phosphate isomerase [Clostridia bacterium]MBT7122284.1 triose-phosphate isomerase [Clostridia bacterium]
MYREFDIKAPFFEIGPKAYIYGQESVELAIAADEAAQKYDVDIIYTALSVDIPAIVAATERLKVFAQHMDGIEPGRGIGMAVAEALKEAGAHGTMLNHAERPMALSDIHKAIKRADEVGLATLVCADTQSEACAIAHLSPNMILAESPDLIGGGVRQQSDMDKIAQTNEAIAHINPEIMVMHSAGITDGRDVYAVIAKGADATGSTSGIIKAQNPHAMVNEMIRAVRNAYDERNA